MPIKSYTLEEGTLTIGATGSVMAMTAQVIEAAVDFSEEVEKDVTTLSGETLAGAAKYPATLSGVVIQDLSDAGLIDYTWTHRGEVVPFTFVPAAAEGRSVTGNLRVAPLKVGGAVGAKGPTSDLKWGCIGDPVLGAVLV